MRIIYEKQIEKETDEGLMVDFVECEEEDATHIHYCYNDEDTPKPCKREEL